VDVMLQMFDAIELLHSEAKLLHRDIKPDNFRYQAGCIKMIDFGLVMEYLDS
jgi:serine/threonine protein kinase